MTEFDTWSPPAPIDCPECGRPAGIAVVYGMPDRELAEAAENGQVALGGCGITAGQPDFRCTACAHEWISDEQL